MEKLIKIISKSLYSRKTYYIINKKAVITITKRNTLNMHIHTVCLKFTMRNGCQEFSVLQWSLDYYTPLVHKPYVNGVTLSQDYTP